jgi:hypothetical protein
MQCPKKERRFVYREAGALAERSTTVQKYLAKAWHIKIRLDSFQYEV